MKINKMLAAFAFAIMVFPLCLHATEETHICKGSGEHCMEVDLGNGMTAKFVKTKGSAAVVIKDAK